MRYCPPRALCCVVFCLGGATLSGRTQETTSIVPHKLSDPPAIAFRASFDGTCHVLDFSPDGQLLAVGAGRSGRVHLLDSDTGKVRHSISASPFLLRFNRTGGTLMIFTSKEASLYDLAAKRRTSIKGVGKPQESSWKERLTIGATHKGKNAVWDPSNAAPVALLQPKNVQEVGQYSLSNDGTRYAVLAKLKGGGGFGLEVFDVQTKNVLEFMPLDIPSFRSVRFSSDSSRVVVATSDRLVVADYCRKQTASIWPKVEEKKPVAKAKPGDEQPVPIGGLVTQAAADTAAFGELGPNSLIIRCLDVSTKDLAAVGTASGEVFLIELRTGIQVHRFSASHGAIEHLRFSDDGNKLAIAHVDGRLTVLNCSALGPQGKR